MSTYLLSGRQQIMSIVISMALLQYFKQKDTPSCLTEHFNRTSNSRQHHVAATHT